MPCLCTSTNTRVCTSHSEWRWLQKLKGLKIKRTHPFRVQISLSFVDSLMTQLMLSRVVSLFFFHNHPSLVRQKYWSTKKLLFLLLNSTWKAVSQKTNADSQSRRATCVKCCNFLRTTWHLHKTAPNFERAVIYLKSFAQLCDRVFLRRRNYYAIVMLAYAKNGQIPVFPYVD